VAQPHVIASPGTVHAGLPSTTDQEQAIRTAIREFAVTNASAK
jgi:hypothetical protein